MSSNGIIVVSGLPRSGTSMLMKMLEAGGLPPLTDNIRTADEDNPKGYYEFERVKKLPDDTEWLPMAEGKAVKVLAELVKFLPDTHAYNIIFIQRELEEIVASQKKMLIRRGEDPDAVSDEEIMGLFKTYRSMIMDHIESQRNMKVLYVNYSDIIDYPAENAKDINLFLGEILDEGKMVSVIDDRLYRNRV